MIGHGRDHLRDSHCLTLPKFVSQNETEAPTPQREIGTLTHHGLGFRLKKVSACHIHARTLVRPCDITERAGTAPITSQARHQGSQFAS